VLNTCASARAPEKDRRIHSQILPIGCDAEVFVGLGFRLLKVLVLVAHGWLVMPEIFVFPMVGVLASHVYISI
jgi:hypothetical protein